MQEIWKNIPLVGYEHYEVSTLGNVRRNEFSFVRNSGKRQTFKPRVLKFDLVHGYHQVALFNGRQKIIKKVHRLVAITFLPNPENKPHVNHKNSIRNDNRLENLEWCTVKENTIHKFQQGYKNKGVSRPYDKNPNSKPVVQLSLNGDFIAEFNCIKSAAEAGGFSATCIGLACKNKISHSGGYKWKFKKDYYENN